jgi:hypothetical protein
LDFLTASCAREGFVRQPPCNAAARRLLIFVKSDSAPLAPWYNAAVAPEAKGQSWIKSVGELASAAAGLAALVYITGGLALQLRLGSGGVPSSVAVPQLPREFLISLGLLIVAPAVAAGMLASRVAQGRANEKSRAYAAVVGTACAVLVYLLIGWLVVSKNSFPAKVCLTGGDEVAGVFIGETDSRTYLADLAGNHPRRIISIPQSRVEGVAIGGRTAQLQQLRCSQHGPPLRGP